MKFSFFLLVHVQGTNVSIVLFQPFSHQFESILRIHLSLSLFLERIGAGPQIIEAQLERVSKGSDLADASSCSLSLSLSSDLSFVSSDPWTVLFRSLLLSRRFSPLYTPPALSRHSIFSLSHYARSGYTARSILRRWCSLPFCFSTSSSVHPWKPFLVPGLF